MLLICYSLLHFRFATYTLLLCCARLITPLVEAQREHAVQPRYTFTGGPAVQREADIQLHHRCFVTVIYSCAIYAFDLLLMADIQLCLL